LVFYFCYYLYFRGSFFISWHFFHPFRTEPKTILADDRFADYNKVLMVYCSSDSWLGDDSTTNATNSTNAATTPIFVFRGAVIFSTILIDLKLSKGLSYATEVILIGQSAGGIGVANHLQFVSEVVPKFCSLSAVLDSAWFIDFEDYFRQRSAKPDFMVSSGLVERRFCKDLSWGFPCCFSVSCMLSNSYLPPDIPIFLFQSKYDIYVLFQRLLQQDNNSLDNDILQTKDTLIKVHAYGGRMQQSLDIVDSRGNINYVFTSCFQHGYLVSSDLWDRVYKSSTDLDFPSVRFKHDMNDTHWTNIGIEGVTLRDAFFRWKDNRFDHLQTRESNTNNVSVSLRLNDICLHAQCNPTCPRLIYFAEYDAPWSFWKKVVLIAVVLFLTIACLFTRCLWILQHRNLKKTQAVYLNANYEGDLFAKVMCLPTCPPHSAIGISCSELDYDITNLPPSMVESGGTLLRKPKGVSGAADNKLRIRKKSSYVPNKKIIKGITAYFNPGQLVAIMGPSGSGKTTLLDVITARKHLKEAEVRSLCFVIFLLHLSRYIFYLRLLLLIICAII